MAIGLQAAAKTLGFGPGKWPSCGRDWPEWEDLNEGEQVRAQPLAQRPWRGRQLVQQHAAAG